MPIPQPRRQIATRSERLEARISPETQALFRKAAEIQGATLTEFVVKSVIDAAKRLEGLTWGFVSG